ncbi:hypothetical protein D1007_18509 [Hordeum vulgare]|nr:hypothetical protein D1007_18509 [Hordeum vulgare]
MKIRYNDSHNSTDVSSSESEANMCAIDDRVSRNEEWDRVVTITLPVKSRKNAPRKPTDKPKGVYEVGDIDLKSWAPTKPNKERTRFRNVFGFVGRARLNINLLVFRKADTEIGHKIVQEIMEHFNVPEEWKAQVEHAALRKARDAWRN